MTFSTTIMLRNKRLSACVARHRGGECLWVTANALAATNDVVHFCIHCSGTAVLSRDLMDIAKFLVGCSCQSKRTSWKDFKRPR